MKRLVIYFIAFISFTAICKAADGDLFPYPQPPSDMTKLDERCDFIISRFWRQCDFKSAMSKTEKLKSTFSDWISLMPYANADTVHSAINRLLTSVQKNGQHTLLLARMAEEFVYSDSSDIKSAEIFLPFAKAASANKKVPSDQRKHFADMIKKIENAQIGKPVNHFVFVSPDGIRHTLDNFRTQMIAVVFSEPGCMDCSMARVRLSADHNINTLIDRGLLTIVYINPGEGNDEWLQETVSYPSNWIVGSMPDAREWFEINRTPSIMLMDGRHKLLMKDLTVDGFMGTMAAMRQQTGL